MTLDDFRNRKYDHDTSKFNSYQNLISGFSVGSDFWEIGVRHTSSDGWLLLQFPGQIGHA